MAISRHGWLQLFAVVVLVITGFTDSDNRGIQTDLVAVRAAGAYADNRHRGIKAIFKIHVPESQAEGFETVTSAVIAFFLEQDARYLAMGRDKEIAGFILKCEKGRYYFTTGVETPLMMTLQAAIARPPKCRAVAFLHTHPPEEPFGRITNRQERFSEFDRQGVISSRLEYFMRTPRGDVRFMNRRIARGTLADVGVPGRSICPSGEPCLKPHTLNPDALTTTASVNPRN